MQIYCHVCRKYEKLGSFGVGSPVFKLKSIKAHNTSASHVTWSWKEKAATHPGAVGGCSREWNREAAPRGYQLLRWLCQLINWLARHFVLSPKTQRPKTCLQETHGWFLQSIGSGKDGRNSQPGPEIATNPTHSAGHDRSNTDAGIDQGRSWRLICEHISISVHA